MVCHVWKHRKRTTWENPTQRHFEHLRLRCCDITFCRVAVGTPERFPVWSWSKDQACVLNANFLLWAWLLLHENRSIVSYSAYITGGEHQQQQAYWTLTMSCKAGDVLPIPIASFWGCAWPLLQTGAGRKSWCSGMHVTWHYTWFIL